MCSPRPTLLGGVIFDVNLTARVPGFIGNSIGYTATAAAASSSGTPTEVVTAAGADLTGGAAAAELGPGSLVSIFGTNLADTTAAGIARARAGGYPTSFNGVEVYFDGIRSPITFVSPTQVNAQLPFEVGDANGVSAVVRTVHKRRNGDRDQCDRGSGGFREPWDPGWRRAPIRGR